MTLVLVSYGAFIAGLLLGGWCRRCKSADERAEAYARGRAAGLEAAAGLVSHSREGAGEAECIDMAAWAESRGRRA